MYNAEIKHQFMREVVSTTPWKLKLCESVFNNTEEYEEKWEEGLLPMDHVYWAKFKIHK